MTNYEFLELPIKSISSNIRAIGILNNTLFLGTYCHGLYSTTDNGEKWKNNMFGYNEYFTVNDILIIDNKIILSTFESGFIISNDNTNSWKSYNIGLNYYGGKLLLKDNNILNLTKGGGVYKINLSDLDIK